MNKIMFRTVTKAIGCVSLLACASASYAHASDNCANVPNHAQLKAAMVSATGSPPSGNQGFNLQMWGTVVNRDGEVCAVVFTGGDRGAQWPGSRAISAQKANTANAFGLDGFAISTSMLYTLVQPGGSLFGLQESNPVDTGVAYKGPASNYGSADDPMVGRKIGGVNVFGGGLPLYKNGKIVGAIGVSGDTSCADHNVAWGARKLLGLNITPGGIGSDNIRYSGAYSQPQCLGGETPPL